MSKQPIAYTVYYKKIGKRAWKSLEGIIEDGIIPGTQTRYFVSIQNERFEISLTGTMIKFPRERALAVEEEIRAQEAMKAAEEQEALKAAENTDHH